MSHSIQIESRVHNRIAYLHHVIEEFSAPTGTIRVIATWSLSIRLPTKSKFSEKVTMRAQSTVTKSQEKIYKIHIIDLTETLSSWVYMHASFQLKTYFIIYNIIEISLEITIGNS